MPFNTNGRAKDTVLLLVRVVMKVTLPDQLRVHNRQRQHDDKDERHRGQDEIAGFDCKTGSTGACCHERPLGFGEFSNFPVHTLFWGPKILNKRDSGFYFPNTAISRHLLSNV